MSEKNESFESDNVTDQESQNVEGDLSSEDRQAIFEERFTALMNGFGEACKANNVDIAVAIALHPKEQEPLVFVRGDEYDSARILAYVLRSMKQQITEQLNTEVNP